jgi:hypothetical protein
VIIGNECGDRLYEGVGSKHLGGASNPRAMIGCQNSWRWSERRRIASVITQKPCSLVGQRKRDLRL